MPTTTTTPQARKVHWLDEFYDGTIISEDNQEPGPASPDDPFELKDYSEAYESETREINGEYATAIRKRLNVASDATVLVTQKTEYGWLDEETLGSDRSYTIEAGGKTKVLEDELYPLREELLTQWLAEGPESE